MKLFENGVGRPSNETLKKRRIFIASVAIALIAVIFVAVYALNGLNVSNLTGEIRKVDVSEQYPYKPGSRIYLNNVKVYLTSKTKILYSKKKDTYYVSSNKIENGRISITKELSNVGNSKKIAGWITESDLLASKVTEIGTIKVPSDNYSTSEGQLLGDVNLNGKLDSADSSLIISYVAGKKEFTEAQLNVADTNKDGKVTSADATYILNSIKTNAKKTSTTKKTTTYKLKKGDKIVLENSKIYKNSLTNKVKSTESGTFYIYNTTKINKRVKVASEKNGKSIGWVNVNDIKTTSSPLTSTVKTKNTYQKYSEGTVLSLVKKTTVVKTSNGEKSVVNLYRATSNNSAAQDYTVVLDSNETVSVVKVKDSEGQTYSVSKTNIAGAYTYTKNNNTKYKVYYDSLLEALRIAQEGMTVYANYDVNGDNITVNKGVTLVLGPKAIDFYNIVNNGTISFSKVIYANEISGNGKFQFNDGASLELSGEEAVTSTGLKFNFPISTKNSTKDLNGRSIISIKNKLAKENAMTVVDKIIVASLNNGYTVEYKKCDATNCTIDGEIVLIKK